MKKKTPVENSKTFYKIYAILGEKKNMRKQGLAFIILKNNSS